MKKLFVFLSIFAVLFVSTMRPLQAEFINDNFQFVNGTIYYFIVDDNGLIDDTTIATKQDYPIFDITLVYGGSLDDVKFSVYYEENDTGGSAYFDIPLTYLGNIDSYNGPYDSVLNNAYVFSFVWTAPTGGPLAYDDTFFAFDTENLIQPVSIYDTIYSLINKFVFGNSIESGTHQDLTATILSTTICVLVFALPFLIIWKVIKIIMG